MQDDLAIVSSHLPSDEVEGMMFADSGTSASGVAHALVGRALAVAFAVYGLEPYRAVRRRGALLLPLDWRGEPVFERDEHGARRPVAWLGLFAGTVPTLRLGLQ